MQLINVTWYLYPYYDMENPEQCNWNIYLKASRREWITVSYHPTHHHWPHQLYLVVICAQLSAATLWGTFNIARKNRLGFEGIPVNDQPLTQWNPCMLLAHRRSSTLSTEPPSQYGCMDTIDIIPLFWHTLRISFNKCFSGMYCIACDNDPCPTGNSTMPLIRGIFVSPLIFSPLFPYSGKLLHPALVAK